MMYLYGCVYVYIPLYKKFKSAKPRGFFIDVEISLP